MVSSDGRAIFIFGAVLLQLDEAGRSQFIKLSFPGSRPVAPQGVEPLGHRSNFYMGSNPDQWRTGLINYAQVVFSDLYPGIDLVYYRSSQGLKYDWRVEAGADPSVIRERYDDAEVQLDDDGGLSLGATSGGGLDQAPPICLQDSSVVTCSYQLILNDEQANILSYSIGSYDRTRTLIIDPLIFSTFLGGDDWERANDLVIDEHSNVYITGYTGSPFYPTTAGALEYSYQGGSHDVFVTKLSSDGKRLIYSTFIGGDDEDRANSIVMGSGGDLYVAGRTLSSDFPVSDGAHDRVRNGSSDAFVLRLDLESGELVYSTLLGGEDYEDLFDLEVDERGAAAVTGLTGSYDFPVVGSDASSHHEPPDIFVSRLSPDGSSLELSTVIGAEGFDSPTALVLDANGTVWVVANTDSQEFSTTPDAYDASFNGGKDVVVLGVNLTGSTIYATYLGGVDNDEARDLMVDGQLRLLITGSTSSDDFPTTDGAISRVLNGDGDVFVLELRPGNETLSWSTLVGGSGIEGGETLARDELGNVYVGGFTDSQDFPTSGMGHDTDLNGETDVLVFRTDPLGTRLSYATFLGGSDIEEVRGMGLDPNGGLVLTGATRSADFPVTSGANDEQANGYDDVFITKLDLNLPPTAFINQVEPELAHEGQTVYFSGSGSDPDGNITGYHWRSDIDGNLSLNASFTRADLSPGNHTIYLAVEDSFGDLSPEVNTTLRVNALPQARIDAIAGLPATSGDPVTFNGSGSDWDGNIERYRWRSDLDGILSGQATFTTQLLSGGEHRIYLAVKDNEGAWSPDDWTRVVINARPTVSIEPLDSELINEGDQVNFTAVAQDPDGHIIHYRWELEGQIMPQYQSRLTLTNLTPGLHLLNLTVQDNEMAWSRTASLYLEVNARPQVSIQWVSHVSAGEGWAVTFAGQAHDPDGRIVAYEWSSDLDGEFGDDENFTTASLSPGNHTISLRALDDSGAWSDTVSVSLVVTPTDESPSIWPWVLGVFLLLLILSLLLTLMVRRQTVPHADDLSPSQPADAYMGPAGNVGPGPNDADENEHETGDEGVGPDGRAATAEDTLDWDDGMPGEDEPDAGQMVEEQLVEGKLGKDEPGAGQMVEEQLIEEQLVEGTLGKGEIDEGQMNAGSLDGKGSSEGHLEQAADPEGRSQPMDGTGPSDGSDQFDGSKMIQEQELSASEAGLQTESDPTGPGTEVSSIIVTCPTCFQEVVVDAAPGTGPVTCQKCWDQFTLD